MAQELNASGAISSYTQPAPFNSRSWQQTDSHRSFVASGTGGTVPSVDTQVA